MKFLAIALLLFGSIFCELSAEVTSIEGQKHYRFGDRTYLVEDGLYLTDGQTADILRQAQHIYDAQDLSKYSRIAVLWDELSLVYKGPLYGEALSMVVRAHFAYMLTTLCSLQPGLSDEQQRYWSMEVSPKRWRVSAEFSRQSGPAVFRLWYSDGLLSVSPFGFEVPRYGQGSEYFPNLGKLDEESAAATYEKYTRETPDLFGAKIVLEEYTRKVPPSDPFIKNEKLELLLQAIMSGFDKSLTSVGKGTRKIYMESLVVTIYPYLSSDASRELAKNIAQSQGFEIRTLPVSKPLF